jgi:SAM-dependent methyltransferase
MKEIIRFAIRKIPRKYLQIVSPVVMNVMKRLYKGNAVECPVCSSTFSKMLPYGRIVSRENALCPECLSLERHRLMWLFLKNKTSFFTDKIKLLHVAPEHCFINRFEALPNLEYITADIESPLAKVKMDVHHIPFEENTFDVVFCNHVLEHVDNDIQAMKEMLRVLKPGGWAILQSPIDPTRTVTFEDINITDPAERERVHGQDDHMRTYGLDYGERIKSSGFVVTESLYVKELPAELVKRYCLPGDEIVYYCEKAK